MLGTGSVEPIIRAQGSLKQGHQYALTFSVDTIATIGSYDYGFQYVTNGIKIYDETDSTDLVYSEDTSKYIGQNLIYRDTTNYWTLNPEEIISTLSRLGYHNIEWTLDHFNPRLREETNSSR